jgi:HEPN domain-containing protein
MKKGRVVPPFEQYDKEDAKSAIDKAKFVFNIIGNVLEDRYGFEGVHNEINKYE